LCVRGGGGGGNPGCGLSVGRKTQSPANTPNVICGGGSPPKATPSPRPCYVPSGGGDVATLVANDTSSGHALQDLVAQLANFGLDIPIQYSSGAIPGADTTGGDAAAAMYTDPNSPKNDVLKWSTSGVATAVANGQDATQIAYHEYDHAYNTLADPGGTRSHRVPFPGDVDFPANGMASLTIGGSTFTYNLNVPSQWAAYEHGVVHNDLVAQFGSDKTGALTEAVASAQNTLASGKSSSTAAAQFGKTNASRRPHFRSRRTRTGTAAAAPPRATLLRAPAASPRRSAWWSTVRSPSAPRR
jgi:hypothetical protein